ncbi:MAG: DUF429 domain-containing protein [Pseudoclavibacter sp.]
MLFVGIDLAAEARRTGVAVVREDGALSLEQVDVGGSDNDLVAAIEAADRTGVDVPLGWHSSTWSARMPPELYWPLHPLNPVGVGTSRCEQQIVRYTVARELLR